MTPKSHRRVTEEEQQPLLGAKPAHLDRVVGEADLVGECVQIGAVDPRPQDQFCFLFADRGGGDCTLHEPLNIVVGRLQCRLLGRRLV